MSSVESVSVRNVVILEAIKTKDTEDLVLFDYSSYLRSAPLQRVVPFPHSSHLLQAMTRTAWL